MANPRIIYVSWPRTQAREMLSESEQFKEGMSLKAKKNLGEWKIAYFGEGRALSGLPANSQIYVLGHSNSGKEWISNGQDNLGYIEACRGDLGAAVSALEECLALRDELGDSVPVA